MSNRKSSHQPNNPLKSQLPMLLFVGVVALIGASIFLPSLFAQRNPVVTTISPTQYQTDFLQADAPHFLLDVRRPDEFAGGHLQGATNINVDTLAGQLSRVPKDVPIVIYCRSGNRSAIAANLLAEAGYSDIYDLGGIIAWQAQGFPVIR